ncbi:hypothetical protein ABID16_001253 [Rhizobium aquaticum]|uniref:Uncharacterized protein n=1 Tax=Rhizobium aquaticum TaxID=1549636 RepID=A0ABV2IX59_9HYPH
MRAGKLHAENAERMEEGRVHRDDREIASQCCRSIGALGDRQAQQQRIRKEAGKADGHRIRHGMLENEIRARKPDAETDQRADLGEFQPSWQR